MINIKQYIHNFGLKIFMIKSIRSKFYNNYSKFGIRLSKINEKIIKNFLQKNIVNEIRNYTDSQPLYVNKSVPKNSVIWIMWWQGLDNAPKIVNACVKKLEQENPDKLIVVITKDNFLKYIKPEDLIMKRLYNKEISITHFSDILRSNLLYIYGGIWIDATVWCTKHIQQNLLKKNFYSIKTGKYTNDPSHGRWTSFFMEGKSNSQLFDFIRKAFNIYWGKYDSSIDYILLDYFIALACDNSSFINNLIDNVPKNNLDVFSLQKALNKNITKYNEFLESDTYLYKLTYKSKFREKDSNGDNTIYDLIIGKKES